MIYTYQHTVVEPDGRLGRVCEKIDATDWLDYLGAQADRYGNLAEFVVASQADVRGENPLVVASLASQIDEMFSDREPTAVFQYALYCWQAFKAGEISAQAWAAVLAVAWQSGPRSMLDSVALSEALVVRMFESADQEILFRVGTRRQDWAAYLAGLPEQITVYRGISTGSRFQENGFSWTLDADEAKKFSGQQVTAERQIPGVLRALVDKRAVLAVFDLGQELVLHPGGEKMALDRHFLSGSGLVRFRQNWKKWKAEEARHAQAMRRVS